MCRNIKTNGRIATALLMHPLFLLIACLVLTNHEPGKLSYPFGHCGIQPSLFMGICSVFTPLFVHFRFPFGNVVILWVIKQYFASKHNMVSLDRNKEINY
jgi:hypothetical protein